MAVGSTEVGRVSIRVMPDTSKFRSDLEKDLKRLNPKVDVGVTPDTSGLRQQLQAAVKAAEAGVKINIPVDIDKSLGSRLKEITRDFDRMGSTVKTISSLGSGLATAAGSAAQLGGALLTASGYAGLITVAGAGIIGIWGTAAAAISAIPAVLGLAAAGLAPVLLGMDGIKDAARTLEPEFNRLKTTVSDTFRTGLTPVFRDLKPVIRDLTPEINGVAQSIVRLAGDFENMITKGSGAESLSGIFENTARTIDAMSGPLTNIVETTLKLANQPLAFDALTRGVQEFADQFRDSVTQAITDGTMDQAFRHLGDLLETISGLLVGAFEGGLAIWNGGAAEGFRQTLEGIGEFLGKFDGARIGGVVGDIFGGIGDIFKDIPQSTVDSITASLEGIGETFRDPEFQANVRKVADALPAVIDGARWLLENGAKVGGWIADFVKGIGGENLAIAGAGLLIGKALFKAIKGAINLKDLFKAKGALTAADLGLDILKKATFWTELIGPLGDLLSGALREVLGFNTYKIDTNFDFEKFGSSIKNALVEGFREGLKDVTADLKITATGLDSRSLTETVAALAAATAEVTNFATAWQTTDAVVTAIVTALSATVAAQMDAIATSLSADPLTAYSGAWTTAVTAIVDVELLRLLTGVQTTMASVATELTNSQTALTAYQTAWTTMVAAVVDTELTRLLTAVQTTMLGITTELTNNQTALTTYSTAWTTAVNLIIAELGRLLAQVQVSIQAISAELLNGQAAITAYQTAWTTATASITASVAAMAASVAASLAPINAGLAASAVQVTAWAAAWVSAIAQVGASLAALTVQFTAFFATLNEQFTMGVQAPEETWSQWLLRMLEDYAAWATGIGQQLDQFFSGVAGLFESATSTVSDIWAAAWALMQGDTETAVSAIQSAIDSGMQAAVSIVQAAVTAMISLVNSLAPAFQAAGSNAGAALAAGLRSQVGAVQAAAAELAAAASTAASAQLQIASPSKVFIWIGRQIGIGLVVGIRGQIRAVKLVMRELVKTALGEVQNLPSVFRGPVMQGLSGSLYDDTMARMRAVNREYAFTYSHEETEWFSLEDRICRALQGWQVQIDHNGMAKIVNKSNRKRSRRR